MRTVSVVIPTYQAAAYLPSFWNSLERAGVLGVATEVVFVDDGSTDGTGAVLEAIQAAAPSRVTVVSLASNEGRFFARLRGAEVATGSHVLFLDIRLEPAADFGAALANTLAAHDAAMGTVAIDGAKSIFNLYWKRTHEFWFWRNFRDAEHGFYLTPENYSRYVTGTTVFLCERSLFLAVCRPFESTGLLSDDTRLLYDIAARSPIWVEKRLEVLWEPRQTWSSFLVRLWERGPGFAEYHLLGTQGVNFCLFVIWVLTLLTVLIALLAAPPLGWAMAVAAIALLAASTGLFAKSIAEFVRLAPLHVASISACAFGAMWGLVVVIARRTRDRHS